MILVDELILVLPSHYICELSASTIRINVKRVTNTPTPKTTVAVFLYLVEKNRIAPTNTISTPSRIPNDSGMIIVLSTYSTSKLPFDPTDSC
jgi:hypothetical protein